MALHQWAIVTAERFTQLVEQTVAQAHLREIEPGEHGARGEPQAIALHSQQPQRERNRHQADRNQDHAADDIRLDGAKSKPFTPGSVMMVLFLESGNRRRRDGR